MKSIISFPGLSIGPFEINALVFPDTDIKIRWYGVLIATGMVIAFLYAAFRAKQSGIVLDDLLDYVIFAVPVGMIGARAYYVLFDYLENPAHYKTFYDVIAIWDGGIAIYGGILGGILTMYIVSRKKKQNILMVLDCFAPGVLVAQALGRWGNFFNAEAYGTLDRIGFPFAENIPTPNFAENFIFRMMIENRHGTVCVHPTFLYESVWNILGFMVLNIFYKGKKFDGQILFMYLLWYGFGRFFIEALRGDSLMLFGFRFSQLVAVACVITAIICLVLGLKKAKKCAENLDSYLD